MPNQTATRPTAGAIARALAHLAWTLTLVVGAPWALATFFGWPLPSAVPDWGEVISTPIQLVEPIVILNFFVCLAWIAWAIVMAYIALDVIDVARGVGQQAHRLGPFTVVARKLVTSAALIVSLARPAGAMDAASASPAPVVQIIDLPTANTAGPAPTDITVRPTNPAPTPAPTPATPTYLVQRGDCLWNIAEQQLGSGFRWREIHDLNREFIIDPDYIEVGWLLSLPADAAAAIPPPSIEQPPQLPEPEPDAADTTPADADDGAPPATAPTVDESTAPTPPIAEPAPSTATTATTSPTEPRPTRVDDPTSAPSDDAMLPARVPIVPGVAGAVVLASGLLLALRKNRQRRATTGARTIRRAALTDLERAVVAAADVPLVRWAGQELAELARQLTGTKTGAIPIAVEFSETTGLEILWDQPFPDAPAPWEAIPGGWSWQLLYDPDAPVPTPDLLAPIPGLVTFGSRDGRSLLVNVEALGSLAIVGDALAGENFVRALVLELGAGDDVANAYVHTLDQPIDIDGTESLDRVWALNGDDGAGRVTATVNEVDEILDQHTVDSTFAYRLGHDRAPIEAIVTVIRAGNDADELAAAAVPHRGVALIVLGPSETAAATLNIGADGSARLEPLGLTFEAAGVPRDVAAQVAVLLDDDTSDPEILEPLADEADSEDDEPALSPIDVPLPFAENESPPPVTDREDRPPDAEASQSIPMERPAVPIAVPHVIDLTDARQAPVDEDDDWEPPVPRLLVKVLGTPSVPALPALSRREVMVTVCLACAGRPVLHEDIQDAVWGGDAISAKSLYNLIGKTRRALGQWDGHDILRKTKNPDNMLELADGVWTDLAVFRTLHARARQSPSSQAIPLLQDALELVDGPAFNADGYDWARLAQHVHEAETLIEEAAVSLIDLTLDSGELDLARHAVVQGLRGLPGNEILYRARMRIEHAAGNPTAVRTAFTELSNYLDDLDTEPAAETRALYGELLPPAQRR